MIDKHSKPTKILWVDLEMTGLNAQTDVILEIAAEITDFEFNTLATYEACVQQPAEQVSALINQNAWWAEHPQSRDDLMQKCADGKPSQQVEQELITLLKEQFGDEPAILGGNSIHNDRNFIKQWWPALDAKLHYRMLDVSAFKIVMQGKYGQEFAKSEVHRAFEDVQESMAELKYYLEWLQSRHDA